MSCLFEPIHGRFPTNSICDSYPDCVGCSYSDPFKQPKKTNADRIRAMSDEELAIAFAKLDNRGAVVFEMAIQSYRGEAVNKWLAWLKQEAET